MARRQRHEEHANHEAWAIPYGDLITLLLAFFVVMYAVSSINEGKYRVLADSLSVAFGGSPRSPMPVQIGEEEPAALPPPVEVPVPSPIELERIARLDRSAQRLAQVADEVEQAMAELIDQDLVILHRHEQWLQIEINTDILFASGDARLTPAIAPVLGRLARILARFHHRLRIEGHTDDRPIATSVYPSNWELSAARAASVVHLFARNGVDGRDMTLAGMGEFHPVVDNDSAGGRNRNRRVVIIVLGEAAIDLGAPETADSVQAPEAPAAAEKSSDGTQP